MPDSSSPAPAPFRRAARLALAFAWAGLIFAASSRPDLRVSEDDLLDLVLRKLAHLFVFGVLAVLVSRAMRGGALRDTTTLMLAWIVTLAYAVSDEWHQTFVPGRAGQASDVAIDMVGATIALLALRHAWARNPRSGEAAR